MDIPPKIVAVTGGAGQIAYSLLFRIANGEMLGEDQPVVLRILEIPEAQGALEGVKMELLDCAFPLLSDVVIGSNPSEIFDEVDLAILVGAKPRGPGMERGDLLKENAKIFVEQGKALNERAKKEAIVFVVGNPCNTNALITMKNAPTLNPKRIFSMTMLDENRAKAQLAIKVKAPVSDVANVTVWGNHSATQVPDFTSGMIGEKPVEEVVGDRQWLETEFFETVQKRGAAVIGARGKSSAASAANAIVDSIQSLMLITPSGEWFSMGLLSNGNPYGIEEDLIYSFPCISKGNGDVEIVADLAKDPFILEKMKLSEKELVEERKVIG